MPNNCVDYEKLPREVQREFFKAQADGHQQKVYLRSIPKDLTAKQLRRLFSKVGIILDVKISQKKTRKLKKVRHCAYITFRSRKEALESTKCEVVVTTNEPDHTDPLFSLMEDGDVGELRQVVLKPVMYVSKKERKILNKIKNELEKKKSAPGAAELRAQKAKRQKPILRKEDHSHRAYRRNKEYLSRYRKEDICQHHEKPTSSAYHKRKQRVHSLLEHSSRFPNLYIFNISSNLRNLTRCNFTKGNYTDAQPCDTRPERNLGKIPFCRYPQLNSNHLNFEQTNSLSDFKPQF
jgi:RNA recognition motif-containing protein